MYLHCFINIYGGGNYNWIFGEIFKYDFVNSTGFITGKNFFMMHIPISQVVFLVASCITLCALFSKDMLVLQSLYLISSILFLGSSIVFKIPVMIAFNIGYVFVNSYQIVRIYMERSAILLPDDLRELYHQVFSIMRPREFLDFINLGQRDRMSQGGLLCKTGDMHNYLIFMIDGAVFIEKDSTVVTTLSGYYFIGEMRYLTRNPMSADVKAKTDVTYIKWSYDVLETLKIKKHETYTRFLEIMGRDLAIKIHNHQYETA